MTPAQRAQLAQQIEQSANQASNNPQLSSALHQLAKSVANGSPSEISDAIKAVETAAAQDSANQNNNKGIDQASQSLQNAANTLASSTDSGTGQISNQSQNPGQAQNPGRGQAGGQAQNPGQSQSTGSNTGNNGSGGQNKTGIEFWENRRVVFTVTDVAGKRTGNRKRRLSVMQTTYP